MSARPSAISATLFALLLAPRARAEETTVPPRSRIYTGLSGSLTSNPTLSIDGQKQPSEGNSPGFAYTVGYLQRLMPHLGAVLTGGFGPTSTAWSSDRGESRTRADLAIGPVFCGTLGQSHPYVEWRLALPVGYSWAWFRQARGRAVEEKYSDGHGLNLSLVAGLDFFGQHHGGYLDVAYAARLTWITHSATLNSDPTIHSDQAYRYFEQAAVFGAGYAYRF
jgi:hypothetical protein